MALRPHHGMCLAYFVGKGYSDGFTIHMEEMLEKFLAGASVQLTCRRMRSAVHVPRIWYKAAKQAGKCKDLIAACLLTADLKKDSSFPSGSLWKGAGKDPCTWKKNRDMRGLSMGQYLRSG